MVNIKVIRASNNTFQNSNASSNLVAVFVGATSGIGMGALKAFTIHANAPSIHIIGRSKHAAQSLLDELSASNPQAKLNFIETEISLMKNVDGACEEIKAREKKVDVLVLSPGYLTFEGRNETPEGIDIPHALRYYTRLRFTYSLLPLLIASPNPSVISVLAGGKEKALDLSDLEVRNGFSGLKAMSNGTTQTTLAFEELAKAHPSISFIHKYPGFVNTGVIARLLSTTTGLLSIPAALFRWTLLPVINLFSMSVDEAGERVLFLATSKRYSRGGVDGGVEMPQGVSVLEEENGVYRVGPLDEGAQATEALLGLRAE
ncbi:Oxidoreductase andH, partial [Lachnellula suecica]